MATVMEKTNLMRRLESIVKGANLSPHDLRAVFSEMGSSHGKLNASLKLLLAPMHRPAFYDDKKSAALAGSDSAGDTAVLGDDDMEVFARPDAPPQQPPFRMFDVATGHLLPLAGAEDRQLQYAMLSHRWQGDEVTLADIEKARQADMDATRQASLLSATGSTTPAWTQRPSDVELVQRWCTEQVATQAAAVRDLAGAGAENNDAIGLLLESRLAMVAAKATHAEAKKRVDGALARFQSAQVEGAVFEKLLKQMAGTDGAKRAESGDGSNAADALSATVSDAADDAAGAADGTGGATVAADSAANERLQKDASEIQLMVKAAEKDLHTASEALRALQAKPVGDSSSKDGALRFAADARLRDAVDELLRRLQKWRSAQKLGRAVAAAKRVFAENPFEASETRYVWLDTCCIDKGNGSEYAESIALMADWYAQAAFTLVYLGDHVEADALLDWKQFQTGSGIGSDVAYGVTSGHFEDILQRKPQWSKRAWTLQELVLSRVTYYTAPDWTPLRRPVEGLGQFYHLVPLLSLYAGGDVMPGNESTACAACVADNWDMVELQAHVDGFFGPGHAPFSRPAPIEAAHTGLVPGAANRDHDNGLTERAAHEVTHVRTVHMLADVLDGLGMAFPTDMTATSARADMAQAVYLTSAELRAACDDDKRVALLNSVQTCLSHTSSDTRRPKFEMIRGILRALLRRLVAEALPLIRADRQYLARCGNVKRLAAWQEAEPSGSGGGKHATQDVMRLLAHRSSTKAVDAIYAVMGMVDVRLPAFHAEGVPRAMARMLDAVVMQHNDVTVFNWAGLASASPVRGRSMYPSSPAAYYIGGPSGDEQLEEEAPAWRRQGSLMLAEATQGRLQDVITTSQGVVFLLGKAIAVVKKQDRKTATAAGMGYAVATLRKLLELVRQAGLPTLQPHLLSLAKIVGYITAHAEAAAAAAAAVETAAVAQTATGSSDNKKSETSKLGWSRPSLSSMSSKSSLSMSSMLSKQSMPSKPSIPSMPTLPSLTTASSKPIKMTMSKFGRPRKAEAAPPTPEPQPATPVTSPVESPPKERASPPSIDTPASALPATEYTVDSTGDIATESSADTAVEVTDPAWADNNVAAQAYIASLMRNTASSTPATLPEVFASINMPLPSANAAIRRQPNTNDTAAGRGARREANTTSPHPIIVTSAGIEGLFDIQRVVITMVDHAQLRRQTTRALAPGGNPEQVVSGWCSISTGFARVVVQFACAARVLDRQLDVIEGIEQRVLREQDRDVGQSRRESVLRTLFLKNVGKSGRAAADDKAQKEVEEVKENKEAEDNGSEDGKEGSGGRDGKDGGDGKDGKNAKDVAADNHNTEDERMVSRVIAFVQQTDLRLVAGEWVLARVSGLETDNNTAGDSQYPAHWFLCHLELGAALDAGSTHFYGHRIATASPIDFGRAAAPETALVRVWEAYMQRKTRKMCTILEQYLDSRDKAAASNDARMKGLRYVRGGTNLAFLDRNAAAKTGSKASAKADTDGDTTTDAASELDSDAGGTDSSDGAWKRSKRVASALGKAALLSGLESWLALRGDLLEERLSANALRRTPKELQPAVENINDDRHLLPSMYHSAQRMHMF